MAKPKLTHANKPPAVADKSTTVEIHRRAGETDDEASARAFVDGDVSSATVITDYARARYGALPLTELARALRVQGDAVNRGDLAGLEAMLSAQAVALNAMFEELARRGALNMGQHLDATDRYIRLALKAQSQVRATVETLAAIKNPPVVFARQANINNGGQQQVNNGPAPNSTRASAHPGETASRPNELLAGGEHGSAKLDTRATKAASRAHQGVEPVGASDRAAKR